MGQLQSRSIKTTYTKQHAQIISSAASRLAKSRDTFKHSVIDHNLKVDAGEQPVWVKRSEYTFEDTFEEEPTYNSEPNKELGTVIIKETVLDRGFDKRSFLPPIPLPPRSDEMHSDDHYDTINDTINDDFVESSYPQENLLPSSDTHLLHEQMPLVVHQHFEQTVTQISHTTSSCSQEQISHEKSECMGYEEMVEIFKPLIVANLIVREILPHLPFIEDHEDLYVAEKRSPREAVTCLLNELKSCKEVGKWHRFLDALQLCGYEYIVQNIKGYKFINHKYQHEYIKKLTGKLNKMIRARELLPRLHMEGLISQNDKEEIEREDTNCGNIAASTMLLSRIPRKLSNWYTTFITVLRDEGFSEIAEDLDIPNLTTSSKIKVQKPRVRSKDLKEVYMGTYDDQDDIYLTTDMLSTLPITTNKNGKPSQAQITRILLTETEQLEFEDEIYTERDDTVQKYAKPPRLRSIHTLPTSRSIPPPPVPSHLPTLENTFNTAKIFIFKEYEMSDTPDVEQDEQIVPIPPRGVAELYNKIIPSHFRTPATCTDQYGEANTHSDTYNCANETHVCHSDATALDDYNEYDNDQTVKDNDSSENVEVYEDVPLDDSDNCTYGDEFYGYEPFNIDEPADICRSKHSEPRKKDIKQVDVKFLSLKKELNALQIEQDDLDVEIKHLQEKNDLQKNVNDKLRQKREILRNIDVKEKEAASLKSPLNSQDTNDYYCPESARIFWKNQSSFFSAVPKTTMHFENDLPMGIEVFHGDPVKVYDPKNFNGKTNWSYTDSAIDCVY